MKARNFVFAMASVLALGSFTACSNDSSADDQLYDQQAIDGKEIKNGDT